MSPSYRDPQQNPLVYLFIDAGHFMRYYDEATSRYCGAPGELDLTVFKQRTRSYKLFYYDCLDDRRLANEAAEARDTRMRSQEEYFKSIRLIEGSHVRLGRLVGGAKPRQKGVDIRIAVDTMTHAIRGNMDRAVLVAGDGDFKPLVESLVELGVFVEVWADPKHVSADLVESADAFHPLRLTTYLELTSERVRRQYPVPSGYANQPPPAVVFSIYLAMIDGCSGELTRNGQGTCFLHIPTWKTGESVLFQSPTTDLERFRTYFELQFDSVRWD
jgi:uncharacterized LabA/DUF88 family protein